MVRAARLLIVDDDLALLEAVRTALSPPHSVAIATTGREALEHVTNGWLPDLVLLDYVLPDASGLALLETIKRAHPSVPIILMTGFGSEDVALQALRLGARDYIKKPFALGHLLSRVQRLLDARRGPRSRGHPRWTLAPASPGPAVEAHADNVRRAIAFIEANLQADLRLEHVAREAGMSKFYFSRRFKATTGASFRAFLARRRIARAVALLGEGRHSISEVYQEVGFKDLSHFSRVFRLLTGQPPSRYRRALRRPSGDLPASHASG